MATTKLVVAAGCSVTTGKGKIVSPGNQVTAKMLAGGESALKKLKEKKVLEEKVVDDKAGAVDWDALDTSSADRKTLQGFVKAHPEMKEAGVNLNGTNDTLIEAIEAHRDGSLYDDVAKNPAE